MPVMTVAELTRATDPRRMAARHRAIAAIHEAGHAVAARWRGVNAYALIWPTGSDGQAIQTWLGQTLMEKTTAANSRLMAVAGPIAEHLWRGNDQGICDADFWAENCAMSETDWGNARTAPGEPDREFMGAVRRVHKQFTGPMWLDVCRTARELILKSRTLAPEIAAQFEAARSASRN